jgi:CIC family chloride channel protein
MSRAIKPYQALSRPTLRLVLLSVGIGVAAGLGAVLFRDMIALGHNLLFLGQLSWHYDANHHTPASPFGAWIILVPVLVSFLVTFLIEHYAPEARGHGVPEVIDAIYYEKGHIRPVVAVIKSVASALSIGSGGSVGREGPIIQIGSAVSSFVGEWLNLSTWERITLIAAGAGGGIAATFNTPIGGVLFATEIIVHEVSVRTLVPISIATATATYVARLFFGPTPSFIIPATDRLTSTTTNPYLIPAYALLGILIGFVSILYIRSIYGAEDLFTARIENPYLRHAVGMGLVGVAMYLLLRTTGHYAIEGIGYAVIQDILSGRGPGMAMLLLLFGLKLLATSLTLGSGASGGIFSPALFFGATVGAGFGEALSLLLPGLGIHPLAFAIAGMAAAVGGAPGAAMTAIVMIFEMTLDYSIILPITVAVALAYGIRSRWIKESIYTLKLTRRGHTLPDALRSNAHTNRPIREAMTKALVALPATLAEPELQRRLEEHPDAMYAVVFADDRPVGILSRDRLHRRKTLHDQETDLAASSDQNWVAVQEDDSMSEVLTALRHANARYALVTPDGNPPAAGGEFALTSLEAIARAIGRHLELFVE